MIQSMPAMAVHGSPQYLQAQRLLHIVFVDLHSGPGRAPPASQAAAHSAPASAAAGRWATHRGAGARLPWAPAAAPAVAPGGGPAARDLSRRAAVFHNQWHCVFSIEIWDQCHGLQLPLQQPSVQLPPGHAPLQIRGEGGSSRRRRRTCVVVSWRARRSGRGQHDCQVDPDLWALSQNSKKWSIFEVHINLVRSLVGYSLTCGWH